MSTRSQLLSQTAGPGNGINPGGPVGQARQDDDQSVEGTTVTIHRLNKSWATATGVSAVDTERLVRHLSYHAQGYQFTPSFKSGNWDGLVPLYERTGKFPAALIPKVKHLLQQPEFAPSRIEITGVPAPLSVCNVKPGTVELRPYQGEAVDTMIDAGGGIVDMCMGLGKTRIGIAFMDRTVTVDEPALMVCPTNDIRDKTVKDIKQLLGSDVVESLDGGRKWKGDRPIMVVTDRSFTSSARHEWFNQLGSRLKVLILDECHHVGADNLFDRSLSMTDVCHRYGLTGTAFRADDATLRLESVCGPVIYEKNMRWGIENGYLVEPHIFWTMNPLQSIIAADYDDAYNRGVVYNDERNELICNILKGFEQRENKHVLLLFQRIDHIRELQKIMPIQEVIGSGRNKTPKEKRTELFEAFRNKEIRTLACTTLADEGLDLPVMNVLINAGGGKSPVKVVQRIGRVMRKHEDKTSAVVIDFPDLHNVSLYSQARKRKVIYDERDLPQSEFRYAA